MAQWTLGRCKRRVPDGRARPLDRDAKKPKHRWYRRSPRAQQGELVCISRYDKSLFDAEPGRAWARQKRAEHKAGSVSFEGSILLPVNSSSSVSSISIIYPSSFRVVLQLQQCHPGRSPLERLRGAVGAWLPAPTVLTHPQWGEDPPNNAISRLAVMDMACHIATHTVEGVGLTLARPLNCRYELIWHYLQR